MRYLFKCKLCNRVQEIHCSPDDIGNKRIVCQKCGEEMHRQFTAPPVHYKGKGFYSTDYKKYDKG